MSRYKKSNLPKQSRTIRIRGDKDRGARGAGAIGEDFRKWYRCWNCGHLCNEDREALGGKASGDGIHTESFTPGSPGTGTDPRDEHGTRTPDVKTDLKPVVDKGCPFCGTMNWRGDYF